MGENIIVERIKKGNQIFSLLTLATSALFLIFIIAQKQLRSLTYYFLMTILFSEIVNSIGNLLLSFGNTYDFGYQLCSLIFISFSDFFTNILFLFFSYSSIKLIKESNKLYKGKAKTFIAISFLSALVYSAIFLIIWEINKKDNVCIDIRFRNYYSKNDKSNNIFTVKYYFMSMIHSVTIILISLLSANNTWVVLSFLNKNVKNDKGNSSRIQELIKILFRYALICLLYWIFLIPRILFVAVSGDDNTFRDIIYLFSESFFCLRGFLISLNGIKNSKIQVIIKRFIEVDIKHYVLLNFGKFSNKQIPKNTKLLEENNK